MMRRFTTWGAVIAMIVVCGVSGCTGGEEGQGSVQTTNYANRNLEYYYFVPSAVKNDPTGTHPLLLMVPSLSARGETFVNDANRRFASKHGFIIIAPSFIWDQENWDDRTSYQYPGAWSGRAILKMVEQFEKQHHIKLGKWFLTGHSAGAQVVLRFSLLWPDRCAAVAAHASGGLVEPDRKVDTAYFITIGTKDKTRIPKARAFRDAAKNLGISVEYREYDTDHALTPEQKTDGLAFLRRILNQN